MKLDNLRAFDKQLQASAGLQPSTLYTIISKDSYDVKRALESLLRVLPLPVKSYPASQVASALADLNTYSLFSEKRIIHLTEIENLDKSSHPALVKAFQTLPKEVCLVLSGQALHRGSQLYKNAEENGVIVDIPELKPWEKEKVVEEWVVDHLQGCGKKITPQVAKLLVKQIGTDQSALFQEMEKLLCYTLDKQVVEMSDVSAITAAASLETIWQLGEALFNRQAEAAFRIASALVDEGNPILTLLRQVRSQFQTEFQVCCILDAGGTKQDVSAQFPYMKGFILDRHVQQATNYGRHRFKKALIKIDETEMAVKSSAVGPEILLDLLIGRLCQ